jgi:hypothetical protein
MPDGTDGLLPVDPAASIELTAGPVTVTLERGALRWVRARGVEIVRGIYGAVRDPSWGTIAPRFASYAVRDDGDAFEARFRAECLREADGVDIDWTGTIHGSRDGTVRFNFDGEVRRPFVTARIGLCVLHPPRLAGERVEVQTPFGTVRGRFPDLITGFMPFSNVTRIRHDFVTTHETQVVFAGDMFEMEDQRAFTDASYKSFSRPLALAWPYLVDAGTPVRQSVTVSVPRATGSARRPALSTRAPSVSLALGDRHPMPSIGACIGPADVMASDGGSGAVAGLGLSYVRASILAGADDAEDDLDRGIEAARSSRCALDLEIVASPTERNLEPLLARLAASRVSVARVAAFDPSRHTTPAALATRVREAMRIAGVAAPLFGGSRGYLYQLVSQGIPADLVDGVTFPANPQVHTFDEQSIMETVEVLPATVRTASALGSGRPVVVGPVSLKALFNPDLVGPEPSPAPGGLPGRYDARQPSMFAAAWTVGVVAALASAGAAAVTLHETAGWAGLVAADQQGLPPMAVPAGTLLPVGHVVAALTRLRGEVLDANLSAPHLAALAVRGPRGALSVLLANLDRAPVRVLVTPGRRGDIGRPFLLVSDDGAPGWAWRPAPADGPMSLSGYGVARLEGRFA